MHDVCNQQVYTAGADQFTGEYKDGNLYRGTQTFGNGDVYEGGFSDNKFHGEGTYSLFFKQDLIMAERFFKMQSHQIIDIIINFVQVPFRKR
jgi:hypothetical protein